MENFKELEVGALGLIQRDETGRISQIGLTEYQSKLLQLFLASMSQEQKLIRLPESYDLILKDSEE